MKKFLITIDTEGDNLWAWKPGSQITTDNSMYLKRFQSLAVEFGFKPVWLTNYEMIQDPRYVAFINEVIQKREGEIGMHLHAWNTPPEYALDQSQCAAPYLIEYPIDIMEEKIATMTEEIYIKTGVKPVSHRAGRWAMNEVYFGLLQKYGYKVDCSVTPHVDWSMHPGQTRCSKGSDYSDFPDKPYYVSSTERKMVEMPVTIMKTHRLILPEKKTFRALLGSIKKVAFSQTIWLRPNGNNLNQMLWLLDASYYSDTDYVMFMLHSSELMPGGSPTFQTVESIEKLYRDLNILFKYAETKYEGITIQDYIKQYSKRHLPSF